MNGHNNYILDVAHDPDFHHYVDGYEAKEVHGNSHEVDYLMPETHYYYRLRAKHGEYESENSQVIEVYTPKLHLEAPNGLAHHDVEYDRMKLSWEAVEHADQYAIQMAYDEHFEHMVKGYDNKIVTDLHHEVRWLKEKTKYYIRMRAVNSEKKIWSRYSEVIVCETPENKYKMEKLIYTHNGQKTKYILYCDPYGVPAFMKAIENGHDYFYYFTHDNKGKIKSIKHTESNGGAIVWKVRFKYNDHGQVKKEILWKNGMDLVTTYTHHDDQNFVAQTHNNHYGNDITHTTKYQKDIYGNITYIKHVIEDHNSNTHNSYELNYTYEDTKYPQYFNYILNHYSYNDHDTDKGIERPEHEFPIWSKQVCNIKKVSLQKNYEQPIWLEFYNVYNDCGFPVKRLCEINGHEEVKQKYIYKGNPDCEENGHDHNGNVATN